MTPMIDIVFQLLIFFMLSSSFLTPAMKLNLPKAVTGNTTDPQKLVLSVDKDGKVFLNTEPIALEQIESVLQKRFESDSRKAIHLRGDKDMPYRYFVEVMDKAREAGARQINIVHETPKS